MAARGQKTRLAAGCVVETQDALNPPLDEWRE
jgi:hypothetical protein